MLLAIQFLVSLTMSSQSLPVFLCLFLGILRTANSNRFLPQSNQNESDWYSQLRFFLLEVGKMDERDFSIEILVIRWLCQVFLMSKGCRLTFTMCSPPLGIALTAVKDPVQPQRL